MMRLIVQHQMIDVAQAYPERVVLEQFQESIQAWSQKIKGSYVEIISIVCTFRLKK
jgi:acyl-CoA oxidase